MSVTILRANALALPLADASVDLIVTSPPYFGLRSYQDGGEHYDGQIGSEATPAEFVDALIAATREMVRVLKPSGSIWVNLGDKYASSGGHGAGATSQRATRSQYVEQIGRSERNATGVATKSLIGIPWRYAIRCIDELGLILRAEVIWSKPNGLPESVTDRVRRSHEQWFHITKQPRYFSAVDEIREAHVAPDRTPGQNAMSGRDMSIPRTGTGAWTAPNPLGKLPGSVWTVPTEPLRVPESLGIDHFAAFPTEWPRRIIAGWSPREVCAGCGFLLGSTYDNGMLGVRRGVRSGNPQGSPKAVLQQDLRQPPHGSQQGQHQGLDVDQQGVRGDADAGSPDGRPDGLRHAASTTGRRSAGAGSSALRSRAPHQRGEGRQPAGEPGAAGEGGARQALGSDAAVSDRLPVLRSRGAVAGECPHCGSTETGQSLILDPFGGTGTTALVADVLGRDGVSVDLSADYCRLAQWRTSDPKQRAKAARVEAVEPVPDDQPDLFGGAA